MTLLDNSAVASVRLPASFAAAPDGIPQQRAGTEGLQRLLAAVAPHRRTTAQGTPQDAVRARLVAALEDGQDDEAERAARALRQRCGLAAVHTAVAQTLAAIGERHAEGSCGVLAVRRQELAARTLLHRLRSDVTPNQGGQVVLAVPPGDQHVLALLALAEQVRETGHATLVVDDLPLDELCELAAAPDTVAVVLSAHVPLSQRAARAVLGTLRAAAAPHCLIAAGGPGVPLGARGADLVSDDPTDLIRALAGRTDPLTDREREVLLAVADGLTTNEAATALGVSSATVKSHLDRVMAKTATQHRAAAVAHALRQGWIN